MIVQPTNFAALTWAGAAAGTLSDSWRVGSVLSGRLLQQLPQGLAVLRIGSTTVEADALDTQSLPQQFQARVLSNGQTPVLEIVDAKQAAPLGMALRATLPRQNGYAPLLASFSNLARRPLARALPAPARLALAAFENSVPSPSELRTGEGFKQALERSGLFYENHLLRASARPGQAPAGELQDDFKGALMRLVQVFTKLPREQLPEPAAQNNAAHQAMPRTAVPMQAATEVETPDVPPPLLSRPLQAQPRMPLPADIDAPGLLSNLHDHAKSALARLEIAQMASHPANAPGTWLMEIPLRGDDGYDIMQVRVEKDPQDPEHAEDSGAPAGAWTLGFTLDLPALGPVQSEIHLFGERVNVRIWAEAETTVQRLEARLENLSETLAGHGLQLQQMQCRHGMPAPPSGISRPLLDASA